MARTRTLGALRDDIRARCTIESEEDFYPTLLLNRWINESWQDLRLELSNQEIEYYLTSATGTVTAGVVSGTAHGSIPLPSNALAVYGVDITVQGRIWPLEPIPFAARGDYQHGTDATGIPGGYHITSVGIEDGAEVGDGTIIVTPAPSSAFDYRVWYLPAWVDLVDDGDVFNTLGGCEQWVIWDVCVKVAMRGNDAKKQEALATREREVAMRRIIKTAKRFARTGPVRRRDARTERLWRPRSSNDVYFR